MSLYIKKTQQELVPWTEDMPIDLISISEADKLNGSPKQGDMIALNPKDKTDMWLVAEQFFKDNYIPAIEATKPDNSKVIADLIKERDELKAQMWAANKVIEVLAEADSEKIIAKTWFETTPQQSLAAIKAQAVQEVVNNCDKWSCMYTDVIRVDDIVKQVDKLREQAE
jgi:hypothetical protein